ncbi:MAG: hypothetical protein KC994_05445 [Candidatus Omnitrophica bacterium]|nr:hypothetical protein [Candidatus Omnitrophota bacterium]
MIERFGSRWNFLVAIVVLGFGAASVSAQTHAQVSYLERTPMEKGLLGVGAVGCSILYTPVKACYAAGGTVASGLVFIMSAGQSSTAAGQILQRSTRGDWFVHPDHLTGQRRLRFRGSPALGGGR